MNCGCCKDLGCFASGQIIDFGFTSPCPDGTEFTFQTWSNGVFYEFTEEYDSGEAIKLTMAFNENSVTEIKIKLPACMTGQGIHYATTPDGACCFKVNGVVTTCL